MAVRCALHRESFGCVAIRRAVGSRIADNGYSIIGMANWQQPFIARCSAFPCYYTAEVDTSESTLKLPCWLPGLLVNELHAPPLSLRRSGSSRGLMAPPLPLLKCIAACMAAPLSSSYSGPHAVGLGSASAPALYAPASLPIHDGCWLRIDTVRRWWWASKSLALSPPPL